MPDRRDSPIISPEMLIKDSECAKIKEYVIAVFTDRLLDTCKQVSDGEDATIYGLPGFIGKVGNNEFTLVRLPAGASIATFYLELLIASGGKEFFVIGLAGSLSPELRIGDILIPTWGIREEGTSYHYMPKDFVPKPSKKLVTLLDSVISNYSVRVFKGGIWTTDAPFMETRNKVRRFSEVGVKGVDMEATALMTVASFRGVNLAMILAISDELHRDQWVEGFDSPELKKAEYVCCEAVINSISKYTKTHD